MLVSTESQQQPAITKQDFEKTLLHCSVLERTWNARETLPCAPSDVRSS